MFICRYVVSLTRVPIRSHSRRTTTEARLLEFARGSAVSRRGRLRVADNWHPFPVLQTTIQRSSDVLKKKRGHVPSSRAPAFTLRPVFFAMCSRYMEHNTVMLENFLPANAPSYISFFGSHMASGLLPPRARWKRNRMLLLLVARASACACRHEDAIRVIELPRTAIL